MPRLPALLAAAILTGSSLVAQSAPFTRQAIGIDSGLHTNGSQAPATVWSEQVTVPGASSLQLVLGEITLDHPRDFIEIHNPMDGQIMALDARGLKLWQHHSAWFNGDTLEVRLVLQTGSSGEVGIDAAMVGRPSSSLTGARPDSICGTTDNRLPFASDPTFRLLSTTLSSVDVCSGWLAEDRSVAVSAGSCVGPGRSAFGVAQFRVPRSSSTGALTHPVTSNQFPVFAGTVDAEDSGAGRNWAVFRLHPNAFGDMAAAVIGATLPMASSLPTYVPPAIIPSLEVAGYGAFALVPDRNHDLTSDTGPMDGVGTNSISYRADTAFGTEGGPVFDAVTGGVVAIHTDDGCAQIGGNNSGTSVLAPEFQTALSDAVTDTHVTLQRGVTQTVSQPFTSWSYDPLPSFWNVVAVTSSSDWDLITETEPASGVLTSSVRSGDTCDLVVASGRARQLTATGGTFERDSGSATARVQADSAAVIAVDEVQNIAVSNDTVIVPLQFEIEATTGPVRIQISGDTSFRWDLFTTPAGGTWQPRSAATASGTVGDGLTAPLTLPVGWHLLVISRDGGTATPSPGIMTVAICRNAPRLALTTTPTAVTEPCKRFFLSPTPSGSSWTGAALSGAGDWLLAIGPTGSDGGAGQANYALFDERAGPITPATGILARQDPTGQATAQRIDAATFAVGSSVRGTLPAGHVARLYEFEITSAGAYDISVIGDTGLFARVHAPSPTATWQGRFASVGGSIASGTAFGTRTLAAGWHAIVVYRNGAPDNRPASFEVRVAENRPIVNLTQGSGASTLNIDGRRIGITAQANAWNVVASTARASGFRLSLGATTANAAGSEASYLLANGHRGTITDTEGWISRDLGVAPANVQHGESFELTQGVTQGALWPADTVCRVYGFDVATMGDYTVSVLGGSTAPAGLRWSLHTAGLNANWRTQSSRIAGPFDVSANVILPRILAPIRHAIVLHQDDGLSSGGTFLVRFAFSAAAPTVLSLSPSSLLVGSGPTTLTVTGSGFVAGATVTIDGVAVPTTFVSATELQATVNPSFTATAGTPDVRVTNPTAATASNARTLTIENPLPGLTTLNPTAIIAGSPPTTLRVMGSNFIQNPNGSSATRVLINNVPFQATFIDSSSLDVAIGTALLSIAGTFDLVVTNPSPGGGTSTPLPFTITAPVITALTPNDLAPQPATGTLSIDVQGANFLASSIVHANSDPLPTTFVTSTLLRATIDTRTQPAVQVAGGLPLAVLNAPFAPSNVEVLTVGAPSNAGLITRNPLAPAPGFPFRISVQECAPSQPLVFIADALPVTATTTFPFPSAAANFALNVRPFSPGTGDWFPIYDGVGIFAPPQPFAVFDATGTFDLPPLIAPDPPLGLTFTSQVVYLDPTAPTGFNVTFPRHPDRF